MKFGRKPTQLKVGSKGLFNLKKDHLRKYEAVFLIYL